MKISIDTQVDTYEDIKKILHILTSIIEKKEVEPIMSNSASFTPLQTQQADSGFMNMFGDTESQKEAAPNFNSFLGLIKKPDDKEAKPQENYKVEVY